MDNHDHHHHQHLVPMSEATDDSEDETNTNKSSINNQGRRFRPPINRPPSRYFESNSLMGMSTADRASAFPLQAYQTDLKFTYYSEGTDIIQSDTLAIFEESMHLLTSDAFFWLDLCGPSPSEMSRLSEIFPIHPLTIEDIQVRDNREKCEIFENYLFICIRTCDQRNGHGSQEPVNLYMIVFPGNIITIHSEPLPHIRHVLRRNYPLKALFSLTSDWIAYALLDDIVDEFMPQMRTMELEADSIDDLVLVLSHSDQADMLRRIGRARKRVTLLLRLLQPKTEVIKALTKRCPERLRPHTILYLRDIQDHVLTMVQSFEHYADTLNRSHSNYLAQISIELNQASNHMAIVMKKLTAAASILLPLSLISGIWGMNVPVPGGVDGDFMNNFLPFLSILTFMLAIVAIMYIIGKRQDWF